MAKRRTSPLDNNIGKILIDKGMKQVGLADRVGVKREYINRIVNRGITPRYVLMLRIARSLGKTVEEVFFEER